ncbi:MAG TPA: 16S rRNA (cytosine(1402)-N(4))-methyltransferase RsmH [Thermomicrobiales bacterium]
MIRTPGHYPVLLHEAIEALAPRPGGRYLDGTFGGGGHTAALLAASAPDGCVLSIDADPAAIARGEGVRAGADGRLTLQQGNFAALADFATATGFAPLDGILLDLGLSSFQLADAERGFSFAHDGPLDMRFGPGATETAATIVNGRDENELADLIFLYGEERWARRIARAIVRERERAPIETTGALAAIVARAVASSGAGRERIHPATRTFQALRIAANRELAVLEEALIGALTVLAPGGRLAIIAFHSLEDRIVKLFMRREATDCICPPQLPVCVCDHHATLRLVTRKGIRPSEAEVAENPRSRSAILRVAERLP